MKLLSTLFFVLALGASGQTPGQSLNSQANTPTPTPTNGTPFRGPMRLNTQLQAVVIQAAQAVPVPTSVTVTVTVNDGTPHTFTYSAAQAEATKNRLVLQSKITPSYTADSFALAILTDMQTQATTDLSAIPTTSAANYAAYQAAQAAAAQAVQSVNLVTSAAAAPGTIK